MPRKRILCISFDKNVSDSRAFALREAGHDVTATTNVEEAFTQLDSIKFDLVIIGHRFEKNDKQVLISEARQRWHTPVLLVCGATAESDLEVDARVFGIQGIDGLMDAVAKLLPKAAAA